MKKHNIFEGDSYRALFTRIAYRRLTNRKWVTNADIMAELYGLESASELTRPISKCEHIKELTKALSDLKKAIGSENLEEDGDNRHKRIRYIGKEKDPLADMLNAKVVSDLKQYWQFCQDSEGFFPSSWLEYFFNGYKDLIDIKQRRKTGEQVLSVSIDRKLNNIELLPFLYESIIHRQVLAINYSHSYEEEISLTFHPHYLKEFNGRWFVLGHAEEHEPENGFIIAIDRICSRPFELAKATYKPAPKGYYKNLFKDIVGVTHITDEKGHRLYKMQPIYIRAHSKYMYMLTKTKIIHPSQEVSIPYGQHADGKYGEFVVNVELNKEFIGRILQMGDGLEVVAPNDVRKVFKERILRLAKMYE